ncbi:hypothetical protein ACFYMI_20170 [Streptomyces collinus]|uniref:hypothetical protein n=1 Tax=Streptomyces collinus TaxID=42684 RepID=UPI0036A8F2AA
MKRLTANDPSYRHICYRAYVWGGEFRQRGLLRLDREQRDVPGRLPDADLTSHRH